MVWRGVGQTSGGVATAMSGKLKDGHTILLSVWGDKIIMQNLGLDGKLVTKIIRQRKTETANGADAVECELVPAQIVERLEPNGTISKELVADTSEPSDYCQTRYLDANTFRCAYTFANSLFWNWAHRQEKSFGIRVELPKQSPDFTAYIKVNRAMAFAIKFLAQGCEEVYVEAQDYHWMRLSEQVLERIPQAMVGHFVHTPWGTNFAANGIDYLDLWAEGMLGHVIGFQTDEWRSAYISHVLSRFAESYSLCMEDTEPVIVRKRDGHKTHLIVQPIMVDPIPYEAAGRLALDASLVPIARRRVTLCGRLDHTKGWENFLLAFEFFCKEFPYRTEEVTLQLIAEDTRKGVTVFDKYAQDCEAVASRLYALGKAINQPIFDWQRRSFTTEQLGPIFASSDVICAPSIADGFCKVPAEAAMCASLSRPPVIAVSRGCGCFDWLGGGYALIELNPFDHEGMAYALERALRMSFDKRQRRLSIVQNEIRAQPESVWAERIFSELEGLRSRRMSS